VRQELHAGWSVVAAGGEGAGRVDGGALPASVPGCVHLDLLAAGVVPDPYLDENEAALAWVGRTDWTYRTTFAWEPGEDGRRVDLVAEGLDTVARLELNGVLVAQTRDMHRTFRVDVTSLLRPGGNLLTVAFRAPLDAAEEASAALGPRPHVNAHPYNALRKIASSYGWDWGPDLPTSGVWRPIRVESWSVARLAGVRPLVDVRPDGTGVLEVHADAETLGAADLRLRVAVAGRTTTMPFTTDGEGPGAAAVARLEVPGVQRWWPVGYGSQHRYDVRVELVDGDTVLEARDLRVGFRTVELESAPDEHGTSFALRVNGTRVLVRGFNWIPDDVFLPRVDRARYERRLEQGRDAGANLVRVWGGGIYESEDFYDVCDELGLLVWQDFLFACAAYAEEEPMAGEVRAEAAEAVTRLSAHPSLVLWCGGNECLWGHEDWGWQEPLAGRTWGAGYYLHDLPRLVAAARPAPQRPRARPDAHLGRVERAGLQRLPRLHAALRLRVRVPGTADVGDPHAGRPRRAAGARLPGHAGPPEGGGRQRQARPRAGGSPAGAGVLRGLALGHPAQPGPRPRHRHRALPRAGAGLRRRDRLATERLLAGVVMGGGRRRRAAQAGLVRRPPRLP